MGAAIFNIVVGIVLIVAATQGFSLMFTNSNTALYVFGGGLVAFGIFQAVRARQGR